MKNFGKKVLRSTLEISQRFGFDILPRHFYSEIPNLHELKQTQEWKAPYSLHGIQGKDTDSQLQFIRDCLPSEIINFLRDHNVHQTACDKNNAYGFGPVESDVLFAFIARHRPPQIVQIGCGISTAVCLLAAEHVGYQPELICIEPYPNDFLQKQAQAEKIKLLPQRAQDIDLQFFKDLSSDVFFFVDSSHTLGPAGEASRIILEFLPRLRVGARIHYHDIYFPYDYAPDILKSSLFFWHESVLLQAFLTGNAGIKISASLSMLHNQCPDQLKEILPNYRPARMDQGVAQDDGHYPASTYFEVTAPLSGESG